MVWNFQQLQLTDPNTILITKDKTTKYGTQTDIEDS